MADPEGALWQPLRTAGYIVSKVDSEPFSGSAPEDNVWAELKAPTP